MARQGLPSRHRLSRVICDSQRGAVTFYGIHKSQPSKVKEKMQPCCFTKPAFSPLWPLSPSQYSATLLPPAQSGPRGKYLLVDTACIAVPGAIELVRHPPDPVRETPRKLSVWGLGQSAFFTREKKRSYFLLGALCMRAVHQGHHQARRTLRLNPSAVCCKAHGDTFPVVTYIDRSLMCVCVCVCVCFW